MSLNVFIRQLCIQDAVYWGSPQNDGFGGYSYANPVEIKVRWDQRERTIVSRDGKEVMADVEVLSPEDFVREGVLFLGTLSDLTSASGQNLDAESGETYIMPHQVTGAYEIIGTLTTTLPFSLVEKAKVYYLREKYA